MKIGSEGDYIAINMMSFTSGSRPNDLLAFSNISIGKTNDSTVYTPFANIYFANIEKTRDIIGDISDLHTENNTSIVNAINEISDDVSDLIKDNELFVEYLTLPWYKKIFTNFIKYKKKHERDNL
jgi:hypothetical protein